MSVEKMLQAYYEKFPSYEAKDAFKLCDTCNHNARWLNLNLYDHCEGCHYEILEKGGLYFVATVHFDDIRGLSNHNTSEECLKAANGEKVLFTDPAPTIVFYDEVGKSAQ